MIEGLNQDPRMTKAMYLKEGPNGLLLVMSGPFIMILSAWTNEWCPWKDPEQPASYQRCKPQDHQLGLLPLDMMRLGGRHKQGCPSHQGRCQSLYQGGDDWSGLQRDHEDDPSPTGVTSIEGCGCMTMRIFLFFYLFEGFLVVLALGTILFSLWAFERSMSTKKMKWLDKDKAKILEVKGNMWWGLYLPPLGHSWLIPTLKRVLSNKNAFSSGTLKWRRVS